jgi:hypothetical protein
MNKAKTSVDSTYMDSLGTLSAKDSADTIRKRAAEQGITLPMNDKQLDQVLAWTINELVRLRKMSWRRATVEARAAFLIAWSTEMDHQGIRG